MSTPSLTQRRPSFMSSTPNMAFNEDFRLPQDYDYHLNLQMSTPANEKSCPSIYVPIHVLNVSLIRENDPLYPHLRSIPENVPAQYSSSYDYAPLGAHASPPGSTDRLSSQPLPHQSAMYPRSERFDSESQGRMEHFGPAKKKRRHRAVSCNAGCTECKKRKIKCDRGGSCGSRTRHDELLKCRWRTLQPACVEFVPPSTPDVVFDDNFGLPYDYNWNLQMSTQATLDNPPCLLQGSILGNTASHSVIQPSPTDQAYHNPMDSAYLAHLGFQNPCNMEPVAETLSIPWPSAGVNEMYGDHMMPPSYPTYDLGQNVTPAVDPSRTLWWTSPDRPPFPLVDQWSGASYGFPGQSSAPLTHACTPHAPYSHSLGLKPSIPLRPPSDQSFSSASRHFSPHLTSAGRLETASHPNSTFYCVPRRKFSGPSRSKRVARAIEYDGIWIDEEELLRGLTEPDEKLTVHQCHWEEDRLPCGLWITGDKSSINAHIQKWHGGEPGGDKLQADCRWSACGKTMLKESIARHIVTVHLEEMWECQGCGKEIVRNDVYRRHVMESEFDACRNLDALITYSGDARKIDARAALQGGGRLLYACA